MKKIFLNGLNGKNKFALIDNDDFDIVRVHNWCLHRCGPVTTIKNKQVALNRFVTGAKKEETILFRDGNILNCQKSNLRIRKKAIIKIEDDLVKIFFDNGMCCFTDLKFYDKIKGYAWYLRQRKKDYYYATADVIVNGKRVSTLLHRMILNAQEGEFVDHKNRNTLDDRECNLRFCTIQQNCFNHRKAHRNTASKYKGVTWHKGRWCARITYNRKRIHLGYFKDETAAAFAYNIRAKEIFGEFACYNEIP
jgi:hypothetical protein